MANIANINSLSVKRGKNTVICDVTFSIQPGEIILLLGANGAGKSTLLQTMAGLVSPVNATSLKTPDSVGYAGHENMFYTELTLAENFKFFMSLENAYTPHCLDLTLEEWNLKTYQHLNLSEISKGTIARCTMARAFWGERKLILLDEPTSALDDKSTNLLKERILKFVEVQQGAVVISTHDIARVRDIATGVIIINNGRLIINDVPKHSVETGIKNYQELNR
jgi:ABC-type multidrug transport system ATPase subunit